MYMPYVLCLISDVWRLMFVVWCQKSDVRPMFDLMSCVCCQTSNVSLMSNGIKLGIWHQTTNIRRLALEIKHQTSHNNVCCQMYHVWCLIFVVWDRRRISDNKYQTNKHQTSDNNVCGQIYHVLYLLSQTDVWHQTTNIRQTNIRRLLSDVCCLISDVRCLIWNVWCLMSDV